MALLTALLLAATAASVVLTNRTVRDQEQRQLTVRAEEAAAVISSSIGSLDTTLSALTTASSTAPAHHTVFDNLATPMVTSRPGAPAPYREVVAVRRTDNRLSVSAATVPALVGASPPPGPASAVLAAAFRTPGVLQSTPVFVTGGARHIGFARSLSGDAVYIEMNIAPYTPPSREGAFSDLVGALYATDRQRPDQAVLASTRELPIADPVGTATVAVGRSRWLLVAQARTPLAGSLALGLPWLLLGAGLLTTGLAALAMETLARRRDYALALVARRTAELEHRAAELERSNTQLERFAYVASHDLSEPLRTVSGFASLLSRRYKGRLDADADEFLAYIDEGISRMQAQIEGLLMFSRLRTRAQPFASVGLDGMVTDVLADLRNRIDQTGAVIRVGPLPEVAGDRAQLAQVFQNLLRNALTFVAPGVAPRIEISAAADEEQQAWRFSVADNGIGVEPAYRDRIFEMFERLHPRDAYPGTGMGLAICQSIVERHGGRIWVEDRHGGGSVFSFTIPFTPPPAEETGGQEPEADLR